MMELAREASLDVLSFRRLLDSDESWASVLAEANLGKERFAVRGTPTIIHPIAFPHLRGRKIVARSAEEVS